MGLCSRAPWLGALALAAATSAASAQGAFPAKPLTFVVPAAAGGPTDTVARLVGESMQRTLGQTVIIENVGGAGGTIAMARVAKAAPDGYTVAVWHVGQATAPALYDNLRYDVINDFDSIGRITDVPMTLVSKTALPTKDVKELLAWIKAQNGKATYGHAGVGSSNYLICKAFVQAAKIDVTLVSYRGGGPALNDLLAGQIDGVCDNAASIAPSIQGGLTNGVVIGMPRRLHSLPNVPTSIEAGLPEFQLQGWNGLFAPKGTPQPMIDKLNAALRKGVASETYQKRLDDLGALPPSDEEMSAAYLKQFVPAEIEKFKTLLAEKK